MPIIGLTGDRGSGKTLVMVYLGLKEHIKRGAKIYANFHLKGVPYTYIDFPTLLWMADNEVDLRDCIILIDEAHIWVDSRTSGKKLNRLFTYFLLQTGKDNINIYWTSQRKGQVELRLRQQTDIWINIERRGDLHLCLIDDITAGGSRIQRMIVRGKPVWPYYDTHEKIKIPEEA